MLATLLGIAVAVLLVLFLIADWVRHPGAVDEAAAGAGTPPVRPAPLRRPGPS